MELVIQTKEQVYILSDVKEFDIRTRHGLTLVSIPEEEGVQGFRCEEE